MSEIRDRDEFVLTVNRLMICAMEDIDCGRDEAGPTTLDLVERIERHDAALRAENERLAGALREASERLERIDAYAGERCEAAGCRPDPCGPVEYHDVEGVPLCAVCWQECLDEAADAEPSPSRPLLLDLGEGHERPTTGRLEQGVIVYARTGAGKEKHNGY